jgi:MFS family permease
MIYEVKISGTMLGIIEGLGVAVVSVLTAVSGYFGDVTGRRVLLIRLGFGFGFLGRLFLNFSTSWTWFLVYRIIDRIGKGVRISARDTIIANSVNLSHSGRMFGVHRSMVAFGAMIGIALSWSIFCFVGADKNVYYLIFLISSVFSLIAFLCTFYLHEQPVDLHQTEDLKPKNLHSVTEVCPSNDFLNNIRLNKKFIKVVSVFFVFYIANSSDAFIFLRCTEARLSRMDVILGYGLYRLCYFITAYLVGYLGDRHGYTRCIRAGWILYAAVYCAFSFQIGQLTCWYLLAVYGVFLALTEVSTVPIVISTVNKNCRGSALGVFYAVLGIGAIIGNTVAGLLWDTVGVSGPFLFGAIMTSVAFIMSFWLIESS